MTGSLVGKTAQCSACVGADAGQVAVIVGPAGRCNLLRGKMQVACATGIAEALPQGQQLGERRLVKGFRRGKSFEDTVDEDGSAGDLGLLQADLADENAPAIACLAPRPGATML